MVPPFEEALLALIEKYWDIQPVDELISALELRLVALRDEKRELEDDN